MTRRRRLLTVPVLVTALAAATACSASDDSARTTKAQGTGRAAQGSDSMDRATCKAETQTDCYTFKQLRTVYGIDKLADQGITGKGRTVAVIDPIGAPNVAKDLETFSERMGLPKPDLKIVNHKPESGSPAPFSWKNDTMAESAGETTMDLQAVHAMAPDAKLVLHQMGAAPEDVDDQLSPDAFGELIKVLADIGEHQSADVVSLSLGYPEVGSNVAQYANVYKEASELFKDMNEEGITFVASSGDNGVFDPNASDDGKKVRTVDWPAADPSVTAVGGTRLWLDDAGKRNKPDVVWNDDTGASGGGRSASFTRPGFQGEGTAATVTDGRRGVPDVSMTASGDGSAMIYMTDDKGGGWRALGGTSLAAPMFAGVVALAAQKNGEGLGNANPTLYSLAPTPQDGAKAGIVDVTSGVNGTGGYPAGEGYDLATGLGTIDAARFVPALADKS